MVHSFLPLRFSFEDSARSAKELLDRRRNRWHSLTMPDLKDRDEIPPGTLYMLVLKTLSRGGVMHGYEIANAIQLNTEDVLQVEEGSLYPALQRMLIKGWVTAEWGVTAGNRRARYYKLTAG